MNMGLYQEWLDKMEESQGTGTYDSFFQSYLSLETTAYEQILENEERFLAGTIRELSEKYSMDTVTFTGFLDGISESLTEEINLDKLAEDSQINIEIDYEKLYYNMMKVKAEWLYTLPQWDDIFTDERKRDIKLKLHKDSHIKVEKVGRNEPCPCGSGKKYKKCCGR